MGQNIPDRENEFLRPKPRILLDLLEKQHKGRYNWNRVSEVKKQEDMRTNRLFQFPETLNLPRLNDTETDNRNKLITSSKIVLTIKKFPANKSP